MDDGVEQKDSLLRQVRARLNSFITLAAVGRLAGVRIARRTNLYHRGHSGTQGKSACGIGFSVDMAIYNLGRGDVGRPNRWWNVLRRLNRKGHEGNR